MINTSMNSQMHNRALQAAIQNAFLTDPMAALQALNSLDRAMGAGQNFPGGQGPQQAGNGQPVQGGQGPQQAGNGQPVQGGQGPQQVDGPQDVQGPNSDPRSSGVEPEHASGWDDFNPDASPTPVPAPQQGLSGPPAGKGLSKDPEGFPKGSVRTAGGYTIVPEGKTNWSIYAPGQKLSEKPHTRIWGDPHVTEKDGTRWDFTRSSDFALPDGTRIHCKTSSETGQSVSTGLTITNGADKVNVTGVDGKPQTGEITHDGYEWRAQHLANKKDLETFRLGGDKENVQWFKEKNGENLGLITKAQKVGDSYEQITDQNQKYWVGDQMRPAVGTRPWGNQFRTELTDLLSQQVLPPNIASLFGNFMHANHRLVEQEMDRLAQGLPIGGLANEFNSWEQVQDFIVGLGDHMLEQQGMNDRLAGERAALLAG